MQCNIIIIIIIIIKVMILINRKKPDSYNDVIARAFVAADMPATKEPSGLYLDI